MAKASTGLILRQAQYKGYSIDFIVILLTRIPLNGTKDDDDYIFTETK
jgi:hypothetical protein